MPLPQENILVIWELPPLQHKPLVISNITLHTLECPSLKRTHLEYENLPLQSKPLVILNITFHALECPSLKRMHALLYGNLPYNVNFWSFWIPNTLEGCSFPTLWYKLFYVLLNMRHLKSLGNECFHGIFLCEKVVGTCRKYDLFVTYCNIVLVTTFSCEMFHMPKCRTFWEHTHTYTIRSMTTQMNLLHS